MKIRIAGTVGESIVDGEGIRAVVFTQGCPHHCAHCHNPETHDFSSGRVVDTDELLPLLDDPIIDGITLTGGEPFLQPEPCLILVSAARKKSLNVWLYTGHRWEEIPSLGPSAITLRDACDIIIDGKYVQDLRTLNTPFVGSTNQRVIDVKATAACGSLVCL